MNSVLKNAYFHAMTDPDWSWPILTDSGRSWSILIDYDRSWPIMTDPDRSWQILTPTVRIMIDPDRSWPMIDPDGQDRSEKEVLNFRISSNFLILIIFFLKIIYILFWYLRDCDGFFKAHHRSSFLNWFLKPKSS